MRSRLLAAAATVLALPFLGWGWGPLRNLLDPSPDGARLTYVLFGLGYAAPGLALLGVALWLLRRPRRA